MSPGRLQPFGLLLREVRRAAGLTQEELAERARVGVRTLRDLETGRTTRPQRSTVDLLASALELDDAARKDFVVASRGWPDAARAPRQRGQQVLVASWRLLTPDERDMLSWLAVFAGRWTLELAAALLGGRVVKSDVDSGADLGAMSLSEAGALVDRLVGLGLVSTVRLPGRPRYWLRDAVRQFAAEQADDDLVAAKDRHAAVMLRVADAADATEGLDVGNSFGELEDDMWAAAQHLRGRDPDVAATLEARLRDRRLST